MSPALAALFVALGPGTLGGETTLGTGAHHHGHASFENAIQFRAGTAACTAATSWSPSRRSRTSRCSASR